MTTTTLSTTHARITPKIVGSIAAVLAALLVVALAMASQETSAPAAPSTPARVGSADTLERLSNAPAAGEFGSADAAERWIAR